MARTCEAEAGVGWIPEAVGLRARLQGETPAAEGFSVRDNPVPAPLPGHVFFWDR